MLCEIMLIGKSSLAFFKNDSLTSMTLTILVLQKNIIGAHRQ